MKILVAGINYAPDLIGIAKYTTEMCDCLRKKGHNVRVVTAPPYYPDWRISKPYSGLFYSSEMLNDIKVIRCPLYVPKSPRALFRILHHLSFAIFSAPVLIAQALKFRPDIILSVAPSLLGTPAAIAAGKLTGAATWLHIQDFEVDAAFGMKFLSGNRLRRLALSFERRLLGAFDTVSAISGKMVDMLRDKGVPPSRIVEFRNWVDVAAIDATIADGGSTALPPSNATTTALYAGNMGAKQGLEVLADVAKKLAVTRPDIRFVFCGSGAMKDRLMQSTNGLPNVVFLDLQPDSAFRKLLVSTDIHLLPQCLEIQDLALPSKLGGMLASGRPIIAMADDGTQLASELRDVSIVVPPANVDAMASALTMLADDPAQRRQLGMKGLQLARQRWNREDVLSEFESRLQEFLARRSNAAPTIKQGADAPDGVVDEVAGSRRQWRLLSNSFTARSRRGQMPTGQSSGSAAPEAALKRVV
jgi:colanic acid biosynthesis glycosyl transferase WcaI